MKLRLLVIALIFSGASEASGAAVDHLQDARAFVEQVYAHYPIKDGDRFEPIGRSAALVFDRSLLALMRRDARSTPAGEVGVLDWDPLCACQDGGAITASIGTVRAEGPNHAKVLITLAFAGASKPDDSQVELDLVLEARHWRVHDVRTKSTPSLRALFQNATR